jgi:hypothetical protein
VSDEVSGELFGEVSGEVDGEDRSDEIPAVDQKHNGFTTKAANKYVTDDTSIDPVGARVASRVVSGARRVRPRLGPRRLIDPTGD